MLPPTMVTITVPLTLPLELANEIDQESRRSHCSIPDMLSCMLIDALEERESSDHATAAASNFLSSPRLTDDLLAPLTINGAPALTATRPDLDTPA